MNNCWRISGLVLAFWAIAMCSCNKENSEPFIDEGLSSYFERFALEGALRGVEVDFESLHVEGFIRNTGEMYVVGQCSHTEESPNAVIIHPTLWLNATDEKKEQVIFHELGHCYLQRGHDDGKDENGRCKSIMHSSSDVCSLNYAENRTEYLDELFNN